MFYQPILLPLLAQVALTFLVWVTMYIARIREIRSKSIDPQQLSSRSAVQHRLVASANPADNFSNLLEMPLLFYLVLMLSLLLMIQDDALVQLAWVYVALRVLHSLIHCTYNRVVHRFTVYLGSCLILLLMWLRVGAYIISN